MSTSKLRNALLVSTIFFSFGVASLAQSAPTQWTPELMLQVKRISDVRVSPDGNRVAFVVSTAQTEGETSEFRGQIYLAGIDGSNPFQMTVGKESNNSPRWSPDGQWIGFLSSREGSRNVWRIKISGGEARQLTFEKGSISSFEWSPDGSMIAFLMADPKSEEEKQAEREKRDARVVGEDWRLTRLYVRGLGEEDKSRLLTPGNYTVGVSFGGQPFDWSPDGRTIAFSHQPTPLANDWTQSDLSQVDLVTGKITPIAGTAAAESGPHYSPDGRFLAFTASDDPPTWAFSGSVKVMERNGGNLRTLASTYDQQPGIVGWSRDGSRIFISETHGTVNAITALPLDGGSEQPVSSAEVMVNSPNLNRTRTHFGFSSQDFDRPPEAYATSVAHFDAHPVSQVQELPAIPIGRNEVIQWNSPDGRQIEGVLTYPVGYRSGSRVPLLLVVHGGPTGVFTRSFLGNSGSYPLAAFASNGYALLRVNPRGSSGYGKEFRYANYQDWGGGDYQDLMAGVDHVVEMGVADADRLGVMGWSYGGYMTSWIITQTHRFQAASVGAGVTNLMSFTGVSDVPGFVPDYFHGEYWETFDSWRSHSAMFQVGGVKTPTLIQHGGQDQRVPISQSYEFRNALLQQGVPVKMVVYPRQPHGIQEPKLLLDAMHRNLDWFNQWILKKPANRATEQR